MPRFPMRTFQQDAILKRLADGLVALEVSNVKTLTSEQCEKLQCGDVVVKKDSSGEHAYVVTFKSDSGMCITYMDASVVETQSYDKVGNEWVYNSEDKTPNLLDVQTEDDVISLIEQGEPMEGYSFEQEDFIDKPITGEYLYVGACKNGNKLTLVISIKLNRNDTVSATFNIGKFIVPQEVYDKLYPQYSTNLSIKKVNINANSWTGVDLFFSANKENNKIRISVDNSGISSMTVNTDYYARYEITFLLSDNLVTD